MIIVICIWDSYILKEQWGDSIAFYYLLSMNARNRLQNFVEVVEVAEVAKLHKGCETSCGSYMMLLTLWKMKKSCVRYKMDGLT